MRKAQGGIAAARCTGTLRAGSSYVRNRCLNSLSLPRRPFLLFPYYSSSFLCGMLLCCRASPSHVSASRDIVQVRGATRPVIAGSTELCRPDWHPMVVSPRRHETVGREPHSVLSIYTHARTQHAARTHARTGTHVQNLARARNVLVQAISPQCLHVPARLCFSAAARKSERAKIEIYPALPSLVFSPVFTISSGHSWSLRSPCRHGTHMLACWVVLGSAETHARAATTPSRAHSHLWNVRPVLRRSAPRCAGRRCFARLHALRGTECQRSKKQQRSHSSRRHRGSVLPTHQRLKSSAKTADANSPKSR